MRTDRFEDRDLRQLVDEAAQGVGLHISPLDTAFTLRDLMVPREDILSVPRSPSAMADAVGIVNTRRYLAVPTTSSNDGAHWYDSVIVPRRLDASAPLSADDLVEEAIGMEHFLPEQTHLLEALPAFMTHPWYFVLRAHRVSGLVSFWDFNRRPFMILLYSMFSEFERASRDLLAGDGCGVHDDTGLSLGEKLKEVRERYNRVAKDLGGNRFVDALQFHQVECSMKCHAPWREFLGRTLNLPNALSKTAYESRFRFTDDRDAVMHGRPLFETHAQFCEFAVRINEVRLLLDTILLYCRQKAEAVAGGTPTDT